MVYRACRSVTAYRAIMRSPSGSGFFYRSAIKPSVRSIRAYTEGLGSLGVDALRPGTQSSRMKDSAISLSGPCAVPDPIARTCIHMPIKHRHQITTQRCQYRSQIQITATIKIATTKMSIGSCNKPTRDRHVRATLEHLLTHASDLDRY